MPPLALKFCTILLTETSEFMYPFTKRLQFLGHKVFQIIYA